MRATKCFQGLFFLFFPCMDIALTQEDIQQKSCLIGGSCLLPCRFDSSSEEIIHWLLVNTTNIYVHTYYEEQDQFTYQDERFKGRTSLQQSDQISKGNASLTLTGVTLWDVGKYMCYTSTTLGHKESFVSLTVQAPVHAVVIKLVTDTVTCSSTGIYPIPKLAWSTSASPDPGLNQTTARVQQDHQGLYNISSSLKIAATGDVAPPYTCSVGTAAGTRNATIRRLPTVEVAANNEVTIDCNASTAHTGGSHSITWTFNHTQLIWDRGRDTAQMQGKWTGEVKGVSDTGSLRLRVSSAHECEGTYTCELSSDAGETYVTNTVLRISAEPESYVKFIVIGVSGLLLLLLLLLCAFLAFRTHCKGKAVTSQQGSSQATEGDIKLNDLPAQTLGQGGSEETRRLSNNGIDQTEQASPLLGVEA